MNIVKRELKANLKSVIIWGVAIAFLVTVWMIEYESFAGNPAIDELIAAIPQEMLAVLGMQDFTLSSLNGFIGSISLYLYLLLGIQAILLGSSLIAKEERDRTAEYLFTLPISRRRVIVGKTIAAIINLGLLNLVTLLAMILSTLSYDKGEDFYRFIGLTFVALFIIQMIFLSIGMLISSISKNHKKSGNISVSILMITFLISSLINTVDRLSFLKYIIPFKYFETSYLLNEMSLNPIYLVLSILIIVVGIGGTLTLYPKRDLALS
ncbi:ABC-2 type transport system permease protein [Halolactibacillus halophilus]|uniref:ABC-2 type transport system permease protein n=1 Tax=Halolactibacillus halophilus TaxID=306540 RepID=A0A1I5T556_9BACI|nr:ABC transporter permease subunit [Halolactibacillus halophilus]GEM02930.1 hypothetical protein HHA03_24620 [Halolactibacillus halophilus]SFP78184.1 ABC-2 type transport system permease protein [Halolactibacillus halophilus]